MTIAEMAQAIEVSKILEAGSDNGAFVLLEEPQWEFLNRKLQAHRFPYADQAFLDMATAVIHAPKVDPNQSG